MVRPLGRLELGEARPERRAVLLEQHVDGVAQAPLAALDLPAQRRPLVLAAQGGPLLGDRALDLGAFCFSSEKRA